MEILYRVGSWLRRKAHAKDLQEEMTMHLDLKAGEHLARGMSEKEAQRQARVDFGRSSLILEKTREKWGFPLLESLRRDLAYGARQFARHPGFTTIVVLTLALGIGANSAIFSVFNALLLKSLPVPHPEELVHIRIQPEGYFEQNAYEYLRDHQKTLAGLIAWDDGNIAVTIDSTPTVIVVDYLSANFFSLLGMDRFAGRTFTPADDLPGAPAVALISYEYWRSRFGLDPSVIGKTVQLKDISCTIIGVTLPGFRGLRTGRSGPSIIVPAQWHAHLTLKDNTTFALYARLAQGVTLQQAQADLNLAWRPWLIQQANNLNDPRERQALLRQTIALSPGRQGSVEFDRRFVVQLQLVEAVVALVLLIACLNLANLLLARGTARTREIAVRLALGAKRGRIIRQLLTENLLLAICGGALGLALSVPLMRLFSLVLLENPNAAALGIAPDRTVLVFTALLSIAAGILFGLAPALRSSHSTVSPALRGLAPAAPGLRFLSRRILIVPQVAISLGVLILTGLLLRSVQRLQQVDLGFDDHHLLSFWLLPTLSGYDDQRELDLYDRILAGIRGVPGVRAASLSRLTLRHRGRHHGLAIDGVLNPDAPFVFNTAAPHFFETIGLLLLVGRDFAAQDGPRALPVAIVNQSMARTYFPNQNPLGRRIAMPGVEPGVTRTIVGVVKDMKFSLRDEASAPALYLPYAQSLPELRGQAEIKVNTLLDPAVMIPAIGSQVQAIAPDLPPVKIVRVDQDLQDSQSQQERSLAQLLGGFGALAFGLAILGLYGTVAFSVSQRTRELAIRFALGATPQRVLWMILRESMLYVLAGIVLGSAAALATSRSVQSFLFEVRGFDPVTYAVLILFMTITALAAALIPGYRANRIEPMTVLRCE
jgi:predicted permease